MEYDGWSDVFFLSQFILSCIMGWEHTPQCNVCVSRQDRAEHALNQCSVTVLMPNAVLNQDWNNGDISLQVCPDVFHCALHTVQLGFNHHDCWLHQGPLQIYWNILVNNPTAFLRACLMCVFQNVLVTYIGMVLSGDYIFSWTNFIGLNIRYEAPAFWHLLGFRFFEAPWRISGQMKCAQAPCPRCRLTFHLKFEFPHLALSWQHPLKFWGKVEMEWAEFSLFLMVSLSYRSLSGSKYSKYCYQIPVPQS